MYPRETKAFSTPRDRAGALTLPGVAAAGLDFAGAGDHTVTLVDNVRDENFWLSRHECGSRLGAMVGMCLTGWGTDGLVARAGDAHGR